MKKLKSRFRLRTLLLTAVTAALIVSSAAFAAVSAAENVTPSDITPSDAMVFTGEVSQKDTAELPENLGDPVITMTTERIRGRV